MDGQGGDTSTRETPGVGRNGAHPGTETSGRMSGADRTDDPNEKLYTAEEAAELLGWAPRTVRRWIEKGKFPVQEREGSRAKLIPESAILAQKGQDPPAPATDPGALELLREQLDQVKGERDYLRQQLDKSTEAQEQLRVLLLRNNEALKAIGALPETMKALVAETVQAVQERPLTVDATPDRMEAVSMPETPAAPPPPAGSLETHSPLPDFLQGKHEPEPPKKGWFQRLLGR